MFAIAFAAARTFLGGIDWKVWAVLGAVAIVLATGWYLQSSGYDLGQAEATQKINEANDAAAQKADKGRSAVDDCYDGGGTWDRARGVCHHGTPRQ